MATLNQCGSCLKPITADHVVPLNPREPPLLFSQCYHIFHQHCLGNWIRNSEGPCPLCRNPIYKHQAGKDFTVYKTIFLEALRRDPAIVRDILQRSDHVNDCCSADCLEDFPWLALQYHPESEQFFHADCHAHGSTLLTLQELASVVAAIVKKYPHLVPKFTPTPPTDFQRFRTDHPKLFTAVLIGGLVSMLITLRRN